MDERIKEILSRFDQDNEAPKSFTIVDDYGWIHFELGCCYGLVAYHESKDNDEDFYVRELSEDDMFYSLTKYPLSIHGYWMREVSKVTERMNTWINKHFVWDGIKGKQIRKVIKSRNIQ